ncbi:hypothetical protein B296_00035158 [Ensete ventricosum]|uniref:Uncharacterized protein n=1 Tax=Ensete ventricosum TaxID=4639 RepID=A0A426XE34_ENSVE|nr:hypothetical protein B296_00035158 [Ensete ventricosum]
MGDASSAVGYYEESVEFLSKLPAKDLEVVIPVVDLAISLAKVADVDRNLGNEDVAIDGFKEAISCLESLKLEPYSEAGLEQRVVSFVSGISP